MRKRLTTQWQEIKNGIAGVERDLASGAYPAPSPLMERLLILGEDRRFWHHYGVDLVALCRAIWECLHGSRQGGSTIAMQLVRTLTGSYERCWARKAREIVLAILLTSVYGRERLPTYYICVAYYGWRMNNFKQACERLHIAPQTISTSYAAAIIARLKYPQPAHITTWRRSQIRRRACHLLLLAFPDKPELSNMQPDVLWMDSK